jgi:hypothetical protein
VKLGPRGANARAARGRQRLGGTLDERVDLARGWPGTGRETPEQMEDWSARTAARRASGRRLRRRAGRAAPRAGAPPCIEPVNLPVRDAGLKAPSRLVRPGFLTAARAR